MNIDIISEDFKAAQEQSQDEISIKLASYVYDVKASYGAVTDSGIVDLTRRLGRGLPDLRSILGAAELDKVRQALAGTTPDFQLAQVQLLPVIPNPDKIVCPDSGVHFNSSCWAWNQKFRSEPFIAA